MTKHQSPTSTTTASKGEMHYLRAKEVAKRIGVSAKTIGRMAERGQFPRYKISPRTVLFNLHEVEAAISAGRIDGSIFKTAA